MNSRASGEHGFTLVELMISMLIGAIVLGLGSVLLYTAFSSQHKVDASAARVEDAKLITDSLTSGVGNSAAFKVSAPSTQGDQYVVSKRLRATVSGSMSWVCQVWYFSASTRALFARQATAVVSIPSASDFGAAATPSGWIRLAHDIALTPSLPTGATISIAGHDYLPIFGAAKSQTAAAGIPGTPAQVPLAFTTAAGTGAPTPYSTVITQLSVPVPQAADSGGAVSCF